MFGPPIGAIFGKCALGDPPAGAAALVAGADHPLTEVLGIRFHTTFYAARYTRLRTALARIMHLAITPMVVIRLERFMEVLLGELDDVQLDDSQAHSVTEVAMCRDSRPKIALCRLISFG